VLNGILLLLTIYALKIASAVFIPLALALLLNVVFASVIRQLSRLRVPAPLSAAVILAVLLGGAAFSLYQLAAPARDWVGKFPEVARQVERKLAGLKRSVQQVNKAAQEVERLATGGEKDVTKTAAVQESTWGKTLLGSTQEIAVGAGLTFFLLFFFLASGDLFLRKLVSALPSLQDRKLSVEISRQIELDVSAYLVTVTVVNVCFGAAVGSGLYALGLPNAFLWGVMAGFLHFIPFLGAAVGLSVVTMVALVSFEDLTMIVLAPGIYLALNVLQEYFVIPLIMGHRFTLNPVVILLWLIFMGWLWGVAGALMAVPLLAILKIVCDRLPRLAAVGEFLGS
jgi:predicted PurR-regulated permease PerM